MWERLNTLHLSLQDPHLVRLADEDSHAFFKRVHEEALLVFGLGDYTLAHDEPWQFITLGKYLERASNVARVLSLESRLLRGGDPLARGGGGDTVVRWLAVLRSCGSAEAYARYYSLRVEPARMVEFLVLNPVFPQSVRFSVDAASDALAAIDAQRPRSEPTDGAGARALGQLRARLDHVAVDEVLEEGLEGYLAAGFRTGGAGPLPRRSPASPARRRPGGADHGGAAATVSRSNSNPTSGSGGRP
jgi:uncharacterized alpha-E superfamily protein